MKKDFNLRVVAAVMLAGVSLVACDDKKDAVECGDDVWRDGDVCRALTVCTGD